MGGFATGLIGSIGQKIQEHNERNIGYQHQAQEEQAQQYDRMAQDAEKAGNDALAADLHKASFGIRTTMPGQKPKKITNPDGTVMDPLDMQGIIAKHTRLAAQRNAQQPQPVQPLAPNGATPQQPQSPGGMFQPPSQSAAPAQMTPPPAMGSGSADDPADNDPWGIRK